MRRGLVVVVAVVVLGMLLLACQLEGGGGGGGETSTPAAPRTGMQAINVAEAAGATPDCGRYPQWMECR